ncbi:MAG: SPOR domain-containing protein [Candidatus Cloacimonetes bacterium]|nr:SPOR domain-containing protein [Candidatus Cloacimonadota bacterium]
MKLKSMFLAGLIVASSGLWSISHEALKSTYEKAAGQFHQSNFVPAMQAIARQHPDSQYGQLAMLELAKFHLLKREYSDAKKLLKQTRQSYIPDKEYWLAKVYLQNQEYQLAIVSAQNYIFSSQDADKIELSYFIIAQGYMEQKLYHRSLEMLETLRKSANIINNIPLLHYKLGQCYEKLGAFDKAAASYQKLRQDFPYSQYAQLADDRIYALKLDTKMEPLKPIKPKENSRAQGKYTVYLQAGAFSSTANAKKLQQRIEKFKIPTISFSKKSNGKTLHVIAAGPFANDSAMKQAASTLKKNNINTFVIKR